MCQLKFSIKLVEQVPQLDNTKNRALFKVAIRLFFLNVKTFLLCFVFEGEREKGGEMREREGGEKERVNERERQMIERGKGR
jgi:hypothetical protein